MRLTISFLILTVIFACTKTSEVPETNTKSEFNIADSDPAAVELADSIISASGGLKAWEAIRFITWKENKITFYWDKLTSTIRVEIPKEDKLAIVNIVTGEGSMKLNDAMIENSGLHDSLKVFVNHWHESAFKLFPAFMLKYKSSVLQYLGEEDHELFGKCNVLKCSFKGERKDFILYVSLKDNLIRHITRSSGDTIIDVRAYNNYENTEGIKISVPPSVSDFQINTTLSEKLFTDL